MGSQYKFEGWQGLDKSSAEGNMVWKDYQPKPFDDYDVDIKISHCGVCGSDIHTLRSGWGQSMYPVVVGHEIVGEAVKVGSKVENGIKVGDRVGVGAQSGSCLKADCEECSHDDENHCLNTNVQTYNGKWPDGSKTYGGYADYWRGHSHFVFKIPDAIPSDIAAPMLCGGITALSPLMRNGAGLGKRVGIVGLGGLGHYGVMGAKMLGCDKVVAISRSSGKKEDAMKMGADDFIATDEDKDWATKHQGTLDLILLRTHGQFIQVGAPEDILPGFNCFALIAKGAKIGGSAIGSPEEIRHMLDLFAKNGVKTWNNNVPMKDANKAIVDMDKGKARYRIVLVNEKHASK